MDTSKIIALLEAQNEILKAQLNEQKMLNQQMYGTLMQLSQYLTGKSINENQPEQAEELPTVLR